MDASIPSEAGEANGGLSAELGQAALDAALSGAAGRAALLLIGGLAPAAVAQALSPLLRSADAAAIVAGDRVAVLAPHLRETGGAADFAARIIASLPPEAQLGAAIGISVAPDDGAGWRALFDAAERALGRAEAYAAGRFAFPDEDRDARWRIGPLLAPAIAEALAEDQFRLVYQPIVRFRDGAWAGAEALIRWDRPGGETWPPAVFIPEAERRGLIEPITAWTLTTAVRRLAELRDRDFRIGVNLSGAMLGLGANEMIVRLLRQYHVQPDRLVVELTETAPILNSREALAEVEAIAALGCIVAIDDFGAGHASLGYVVRLPARRIKLDASLVRVCLTNGRARAAIRATTMLAHEIGADVVAEGVRNEEMAQALLEMGVDYGQGFAMAMPAEFIDFA